MADYIKEHILEEFDVYKLKARWRSDIYSLPSGFSSFLSNCMESFWALLEGSFPKKHRHM
eukprot:3049410-Karenia_brevis.AAC.1